MRRSTRLQCQRKGGREEAAANFLTCHQDEDPPWLAVRKVSEDIGYGLFTEKNLLAGDCIIEYTGEICTEEEGDRKEDQTFLFYFRDGRKKLCIDASSSKRMGKFANDEWNEPNDQGLPSKGKLPETTHKENDYEEQDIPSTSVQYTTDDDDDADMEAEDNDQGLPSKEKLPETTHKESDYEEQDIPSTSVQYTTDDDDADMEAEDNEQDIPSTSVQYTTDDDDADMEAEDNDQGLPSKEKLPETTHKENDYEEQDIPSTSVQYTTDDNAYKGDPQFLNEQKHSKSEDIPEIHASKSSSIEDNQNNFEQSSDSEDTGSESDTSEYTPDGEEYSDMEDIPETHESQLSFMEDHQQHVVGDSQDEVGITSSSPMANDEANISSSSEVTNSHIVVQVTSNAGHRVFDKKFPCFYCLKPQAQIQRHLREQHHQESEVQEIINEKDKQKKDKLMTLLRNRGTHRHNCQVIRERKGTLIVSYRPSTYASPADYGPCDCCLGYFVRTDLWKHNCKLKSRKNVGSKSKPAISCKLLLPNPTGISAGLHRVTRVMCNDQISLVAKNDPVIVDLGERHFLSHGHDEDMHATIRSKMRESARLLVELRSLAKKPNARMEDFIDPTHFRTVVAAVQKVTGYEENAQDYKVPSLALKYGHSLKKMASVLTGNASEVGDNSKYTKCKQFIERCDADWSVFVSSNALRTIDMKKLNNRKLIPLTEDVAALTNMLKQKGRQCVEELLKNSEEPTEEKVEAWRELNELTLTQLMLFNRRRQGEVSKMKMTEVEKIAYLQKDSNVVNSLSVLEKHLCEVLSRVEIVGKRGRLVPVIMTLEMREWVTLLLETRHDVGGVDEENEYVFARSFYGSKGHIRACDSLRKYSRLCGAKYPDTLTGTQLRKQLATLCQLLNLKENEMDMVANFLGHDLKIHREYYRLPMEIMQVAKVSKILFSMEKGAVSQGKNLDDVSISDEELEQSSPTDGDEEMAADNTGQKATKFCKAKAFDHTVTKPHKSKRRKICTKRRPWNELEKAAVNRHFHHMMVLNKLPGRSAIEECQRNEPALSHRTWTNIKDYCRNTMKHLLED